MVIVDDAFLVAEIKNIITSLRSPACNVADKAEKEQVLWQAIRDIAGQNNHLVDQATFERLYHKHYAMKYAFLERRQRSRTSG
ncbi:hypothetical protein EV210_101216 [Anaerospora hongkongensis]|uniref:Uncharacterized protein n=1 Tax=Anaerospora hongkongensis TaxID=244830 RepID=A0A4R1Q625_9FIRM|nr:hypothetical protein [Anaerospora hongkongensis]TCL40016.1 hypothetical protein EV210_101216 [Anaerospora hongkongensis]